MNERKAYYYIFISLSSFFHKNVQSFKFPHYCLSDSFCFPLFFLLFTFYIPYVGCVSDLVSPKSCGLRPTRCWLGEVKLYLSWYLSPTLSSWMKIVTSIHSFSYPSTIPERCSILFVINSRSSISCSSPSVSIRRSIHELRFLRFHFLY